MEAPKKPPVAAGVPERASEREEQRGIDGVQSVAKSMLRCMMQERAGGGQEC